MSAVSIQQEKSHKSARCRFPSVQSRRLPIAHHGKHLVGFSGALALQGSLQSLPLSMPEGLQVTMPVPQ
jgi:hypothetical protein